jgi:mannose-6-phosphate isomerase
MDAVLQPVAVEAGSCIYIPGGRVHAIGEGCLILEVQQNSNTTYRVYDWGRVSPDGRPRELHVKQAFQCIDWRARSASATVPVRTGGPGPNIWWEIMKCPYFHVSRVDLQAPAEVRHDGHSFHALFTLAGHVVVEAGGVSETNGPGVSCLLPASLPAYRLTPVSKPASVICIRRG